MDALKVELPQPPIRTYVKSDVNIDEWESLKSYYDDLLYRELESKADLDQWMLDRNELDTMISEEMGWRYIKMTIDTTDKEAEEKYTHFISEIEPQISPYIYQLNNKLIDSEYCDELDQDLFFTYLRSVKKQIEIFREENIPLFRDMQIKEQEYGIITGSMVIEHDGEELTLQQAARLLQSTDRELRETIYRKVQSRRIQDKDKLDILFDELLQLRHQVALNADFDNFRDYMFAAMGRFDYTPQDCFDFHASIEKEFLPLVGEMRANRKKQLGLDELRPWDLEVDLAGQDALKPFDTVDELLDKSIDAFHQLRPYFGERLQIMKEMGHLDLASRKGKAPGGYNYPLMETGVPFIFMNAASSVNDVKTMVHEGGHAIHSFLTRQIPFSALKSTPSEVAELASMSMELLSMDHWDVFYRTDTDLTRAKKDQLQGVITVFPWVAAVDAFQHWLYTNPGHSAEERRQAWKDNYNRFSSNEVEWDGLEEFFENTWQKQLHIFEVPFYYIEYAMAQLGAIAVWKSYKENKEKALDDYMDALRLGYTKPIGEIYKTAGIQFSFDRNYVADLAHFVSAELKGLS